MTLYEAATTTTTTAAKHVGLPNHLGFGSASWIKYAVIFGALIAVVGAVIAMRPTDKVRKNIGGRVVGIAGRMGSGKTYMAVMIAWQHLLAGHDVRTNFTMDLPAKYYEPRLSTTGVSTGIARMEIERARKERRKPTGLPWYHCLVRCSVPWEYFRGWDQFATLDNAVVVVDECQLYAPSYRPMAFPLIARWKLAMARKFKLDVYWISQHEDRVNSTLKHLTNLIYICNSWFGSTYFSAKGYEPEYVRRKQKHIARKAYRFKLANAKLYDTLEIITPDEHLGDEKVSANMDGIHAIAEQYQGRRPGDYGPCVAVTKKGTPCTHRAISETLLCGQHEKAGQTVEQVLEAARAYGLETDIEEKKLRSVPTPKATPFRLPSEPPTLPLCYGLAPSGEKCGQPTPNANGLCDACISRARLSVVKS